MTHQTTLLKYKEELVKSLEYLQHEAQPSKDEESYIEYLIIWLKVRQICLNVQRLVQENPSISSDISIFLNLLSKFKRTVQPKLSEYMASLKKRSMADRIVVFTHQMQDYYETANQYIKNLPSEAMRIYEHAWFFLLLYRFALDQFLIRNVRTNLQKKMDSLKKAFEIEAGDAHLATEQKELSSQMKSSLKIRPETSESQISATSENSSASLGDSSGSSEDVVLTSEIILPEETPLDGETVSTPQVDYPSSLQQDAQLSQRSSYAYAKWFPRNEWQTFRKYKYCFHCGKILDPNTRKCTGCGTQL